MIGGTDWKGYEKIYVDNQVRAFDMELLTIKQRKWIWTS